VRGEVTWVLGRETEGMLTVRVGASEGQRGGAGSAPGKGEGMGACAPERNSPGERRGPGPVPGLS